MGGFRGLLILMAIFGLGWGGSFAAGMAVGAKQLPPVVAQAAALAARSGAEGGAGARQSAAQGEVGALRGQGGPGQQGTDGPQGQRPAVNGTVERVEGNVVVLSGPSGSVRITIGEQTAIQRSAPGTREDLQPGARVTVVGQPGQDGTVTAQAIQIGGAPAAAPAGRTQRPGR